MAAFGLTPEDFGEEDVVQVWPDCWAAVQLLAAVSTQWRVSMAGAYGLDYAALFSVMQVWGVRKKKRAEMLHDIRVMEQAVLEMWQEGKNG